MFSERNKATVLATNNNNFNRIEKCVHDTFKDQALQRPNANAVHAWDAQLTYSDLDMLSDNLAHYLAQSGVQVEDKVSLCFEKSAWVVVSMMAVLKAGGTCVSLDPSHPRDRSETIIRDAGCHILLSAPGVSGMFSDMVDGLLVLNIDEQFVESLANANTKFEPNGLASPDNAAFIVYTSGSTGVPKGVVLEHASVSTSARAHGTVLDIGPSSRVLQFAAHVFDISIQDIFTTLTRGGCVCIPSESERLNDLEGAINRMQVNWACITPTVATLLRPSNIRCLKTLTLAGEAVTKKAVDIWGGNVNLNNCYGPAESTIYCAWNGKVTPQSPSNIGTGLSSNLWVVDVSSHDRLAPVGCIGELVIEGPLLAREYLNDPDKTLASFITNPAWADVDSISQIRRMYKTGDLVRYNVDGSLDYLGRKDSQVKIHGQRLELSEIEHHLAANDGIENAMVILPKGLQVLVAITTLRKSSQPLAESISNVPPPNDSINILDGYTVNIKSSHLRDQLATLVPSYMVPKIWITIESMPRNTSGKLDRARVARWVNEMGADLHNLSGLSEDIGDKGPTTAMERRVQAIIARVLNIAVESVGFSRSFQQLGGDSITAMQVATRARSEGFTLRVQDILGSQSISALALVANSNTQSLASHKDEVDIDFDLSPVQQLYFDMGHSHNHNSRYNQSFFLRIARDVTVEQIGQAIEALVRQHSMLRARFTQSESGTWTQRISKDVGTSYRFQEYQNLAEENLATVLEASQTSIDIERGPVFAADLLHVKGSTQQLLFLAAHHLVIDLVSWRILLHDLEEILERGMLTSPTPFPFQVWNKLQAEYVDQNLSPKKVLPFEVAPAQYEFWGMEGKPNVYEHVVSDGFSMDSDLITTLIDKGRNLLNVNPEETFMATLLYAFAQIFDSRPTPTVFTEGHGREPWTSDIDISNTVGWFTTLSPFHIPVSVNTTLIQAIAQTKDTQRTLPGKGWPYFASRFLNREAKISFQEHMPMEVIFNYMGRYQQLEHAESLLKPEPLPVGANNVSADVTRLALFEVSIIATQTATHFTLAYNSHMEHQDSIRKWVRAWEQTLTAAITALAELNEPDRTLSDFPLLPLTYDGLKSLKAERLPDIGINNFDNVEDIYPCSPMQQGLLLSQGRESGNYEIQFTYSITPSQQGAQINSQRLLSAWQQVLNRHAILRTVFVNSVTEDGGFDQVVLKKTSGRTKKLVYTDEFHLKELLNEEHLIDSQDVLPPHQLLVYTSASGSTYVKIGISHAIIDATSMAIILGELTLAYESKLPDVTGPLYSHYIQYIRSQTPADSLNYWTNYLQDVQTCHFPTTHIDEDVKKLNTLNAEINIGDEQLRQFCLSHGVTTANIVQTAWAIVLRLYTGNSDVCFGYLSSGRDLPVDDIDGIVGPLINMLVCRLQTAPSTNIVELVQQVQQNYVTSLEHQHCSLAQIQHALSLSGRPLFNTIISVQRGTSTTEDGTSLVQQQPEISFTNVGTHDPTEVSGIGNSKFGKMLIVIVRYHC